MFLLFKDLSPEFLFEYWVVDSMHQKSSECSELPRFKIEFFFKTNLTFSINKILFWFFFNNLTPNFFKHLIVEKTSSDSKTFFNFDILAYSLIKKDLIEIDLSLSMIVFFIFLYFFRDSYGKTFV